MEEQLLERQQQQEDQQALVTQGPREVQLLLVLDQLQVQLVQVHRRRALLPILLRQLLQRNLWSKSQSLTLL